MYKEKMIKPILCKKDYMHYFYMLYIKKELWLKNKWNKQINNHIIKYYLIKNNQFLKY